MKQLVHRHELVGGKRYGIKISRIDTSIQLLLSFSCAALMMHDLMLTALCYISDVIKLLIYISVLYLYHMCFWYACAQLTALSADPDKCH